MQCLPDRLGAVGTYGKEYYFDYPAAAPIARFILISPGLTFTNGGSYDGDVGYFANWMGNNINPTNRLVQFTVSADQLSVAANFMGSTAPNNFTDAFTITGSTSTLTPPPGGGITLRAAASGTNCTSSSSLTIGLPAGTQSGDVMIAHVVVRTAGNTITAPAGWNLVLRQDSPSVIATASYVHIASSTEPAGYTWSFGTAGQASGGIASYMGVNTTTPVDASHAQYNASTSNVDNSGVTTTTANDMLVYAVGIMVTTTVNVPAGFTQAWSDSSNSATTSEMSQEFFASTGATGTIHGTHNGGANSNLTMLIALKPV